MNTNRVVFLELNSWNQKEGTRDETREGVVDHETSQKCCDYAKTIVSTSDKHHSYGANTFVSSSMKYSKAC